MAESPPATRTVDEAEARETWSQLLEQITRSSERVIVEKGGTPIAAIISARDLERLRHLEEERQRDIAVIADMRAAFEGVPPEEIDAEAARALAEVRGG